ncbi:hypothetical protein ACHAXT_012485 [Thalassiosira profunda]
MSAPRQRPQGSAPRPQRQPDDGKITPELLVDALSGHEDGLLSIAERLMTHYDAGYDAMGEAIIDAFADVQKLFQHVVEAAHMEGAALERERGEGEWRKRLEGMGVDADGVLYGKAGEALDGSGEGDMAGEDAKNASRLSQEKPEDHRHEELIDQDVRDVLIDAIKAGQSHRDAQRFDECRSLYESACASASALLPVDSDHRGRLQLAVARAESMSSDRACAILKYAMDDVLRSGLTLRQGKYPQMDVNERSDCVLSRPNPLRQTPSRGYDDKHAWEVGGNYNPIGPDTSMVEQSAEEALNSLVEEMKEMLAAPVYNLTPLQELSTKFWAAMDEAKKSGTKKEDRLEQALAKIKADFLLAREEYEEQLNWEREKSDGLKRRVNQLRLAQSEQKEQQQGSQTPEEGDGLQAPHTPNRPQSVSASQSTPNSGGLHSYHFAGMEDGTVASRLRQGAEARGFDTQSVASTASEFAQRAKSLVHLLNCQSGERGIDGGEPLSEQYPVLGGATERNDLDDSRI